MGKVSELVLTGAALEPECYTPAHEQAARWPSFTLFTSSIDFSDRLLYITIFIFIIF